MKSTMHGLLILDDKTRFKIRLDAKPVTDTHMVYETWGRHDYNPKGFPIPNSACVIDIGAHIGAFTIFAAKQASKGQVLAFEPFPENFQLLQENVAANRLKNVKLFKKGVGAKNEELRLYIDDMNNAGHSLYNVSDESVKIRLVSLDGVFSENNLKHCDFLKIDCEGAEYEILFNASKVTLSKINTIAMEYHDGIYRKLSVKDMVKLLRSNNFEVNLKDPSATQGLLYAKRAI